MTPEGDRSFADKNHLDWYEKLIAAEGRRLQQIVAQRHRLRRRRALFHSRDRFHCRSFVR